MPAVSDAAPLPPDLPSDAITETFPEEQRPGGLFTWLYPGMRVKRWLALIPVGFLLGIVGVMILFNVRTTEFVDYLGAFFRDVLHLNPQLPLIHVSVGLALTVFSLALICLAMIGLNRSILSAIAPEQMRRLPEVIHQKRALAQGARIVVIGGGTGLSTLLRGLKKSTSNITAVVTMTDDGGSSGVLQRQMAGGMLPPGDIRNCLVALADAEPLMQELFQYRFATRAPADGLSGHSFGNLLIAAMTDVTGDFEKAVKTTSEILNIRGRVLPSTVEAVVLVGEMEDGREVTGETRIAKDPGKICRIRLCPDSPKPLPEVLEAIRQADIIVMGPGSVFTSVIPNLLVPQIRDAVAAAQAIKVYVCNVMTQPGETDHFKASDHVQAIRDHIGEARVFDYVLVNRAVPSPEAMERYTKTGAQLVEADVDAIALMGYKPITGAHISESAVVRHASDELARTIMRLWSGRALRRR